MTHGVLVTGKSLLQWAVDNKRSSTVLELLNDYRPKKDRHHAPAFHLHPQQHLDRPEGHLGYEVGVQLESQHESWRSANQTERGRVGGDILCHDRKVSRFPNHVYSCSSPTRSNQLRLNLI